MSASWGVRVAERCSFSFPCIQLKYELFSSTFKFKYEFSRSRFLVNFKCSQSSPSPAVVASQSCASLSHSKQVSQSEIFENRRICQDFFKICKICILSHRAKLKFQRNLPNFAELRRFLQNFAEISANSTAPKKGPGGPFLIKQILWLFNLVVASDAN